jgi:hypothetical protein
MGMPEDTTHYRWIYPTRGVTSLPYLFMMPSLSISLSRDLSLSLSLSLSDRNERTSVGPN